MSGSIKTPGSNEPSIEDKGATLIPAAILGLKGIEVRTGVRRRAVAELAGTEGTEPEYADFEIISGASIESRDGVYFECELNPINLDDFIEQAAAANLEIYPTDLTQSSKGNIIISGRASSIEALEYISSLYTFRINVNQSYRVVEVDGLEIPIKPTLIDYNPLIDIPAPADIKPISSKTPNQTQSPRLRTAKLKLSLTERDNPDTVIKFLESQNFLTFSEKVKVETNSGGQLIITSSAEGGITDLYQLALKVSQIARSIAIGVFIDEDSNVVEISPNQEPGIYTSEQTCEALAADPRLGYLLDLTYTKTTDGLKIASSELRVTPPLITLVGSQYKDWKNEIKDRALRAEQNLQYVIGRKGIGKTTITTNALAEITEENPDLKIVHSQFREINVNANGSGLIDIAEKILPFISKILLDMMAAGNSEDSELSDQDYQSIVTAYTNIERLLNKLDPKGRSTIEPAQIKDLLDKALFIISELSPETKMIIVVEDEHFADPISQSLLHDLIERLNERPNIQFLITSRYPYEAANDIQQNRIADRHRQHQSRTIKVTGLTFIDSHRKGQYSKSATREYKEITKEKINDENIQEFTKNYLNRRYSLDPAIETVDSIEFAKLLRFANNSPLRAQQLLVLAYERDAIIFNSSNKATLNRSKLEEIITQLTTGDGLEGYVLNTSINVIQRLNPKERFVLQLLAFIGACRFSKLKSLICIPLKINDSELKDIINSLSTKDLIDTETAGNVIDLNIRIRDYETILALKQSITPNELRVFSGLILHGNEWNLDQDTYLKLMGIFAANTPQNIQLPNNFWAKLAQIIDQAQINFNSPEQLALAKEVTLNNHEARSRLAELINNPAAVSIEEPKDTAILYGLGAYMQHAALTRSKEGIEDHFRKYTAVVLASRQPELINQFIKASILAGYLCRNTSLLKAAIEAGIRNNIPAVTIQKGLAYYYFRLENTKVNDTSVIIYHGYERYIRLTGFRAAQEILAGFSEVNTNSSDPENNEIARIKLRIPFEEQFHALNYDSGADSREVYGYEPLTAEQFEASLTRSNILQKLLKIAFESKNALFDYSLLLIIEQISQEALLRIDPNDTEEVYALSLYIENYLIEKAKDQGNHILEIRSQQMLAHLRRAQIAASGKQIDLSTLNPILNRLQAGIDIVENQFAHPQYSLTLRLDILVFTGEFLANLRLETISPQELQQILALLSICTYSLDYILNNVKNLGDYPDILYELGSIGHLISVMQQTLTVNSTYQHISISDDDISELEIHNVTINAFIQLINKAQIEAALAFANEKQKKKPTILVETNIAGLEKLKAKLAA